jgi:twinkle protein
MEREGLLMKQNGLFIRHAPCPECGGSDPLALYQKADGSIDGTCFSCGAYIPPDRVDPTIQIRKTNTKMDYSFVDNLPSRGWRERRVSLPISEFYGVKAKMDGDKCINRYYPVTIAGEVSGYKVRNCVEKDFHTLGTVGKHCELFGQSRFPANGKFLVICEGEEDALSSFQMLSNEKYRTPCVSTSVGAGGTAEQIKANYKWVSSFETVVLCFDSDEPGQKSAEECARILKPGQAKIMKLRLKDANEYLMQRQEKEFVEAFWRAERYSPAGIVGSSNTWDALVQRAKFVKISLPAFAVQLERMLNGGIALSEITTIAAASGIGKSSITYEFLYHWIFNSEYKVGIISLESDVGELIENLMSLHLGKKLANMPDERKLDFYKTDEAKKAHTELTQLPDGSDRFIIVDHQGEMNDVQEKMEYLVKVNGCKVTILDPMTLALSGRGLDSTDQFMSWLVSYVKREQVAHINVVHVRKAPSGQKAGSAGGTIHEEDAKGSGSIFQNSMNNILVMRDKENVDPMVRNTTKVVMSKSRRTGNTGPAGFWFYNNETSRMELGKDPANADYHTDEETFVDIGATEVVEEEF